MSETKTAIKWSKDTQVEPTEATWWDDDGLTKRAFERILTLAAQPIKKDAQGLDKASEGTSVSQIADRYTGKRKRPNKTEGVEG